jgi:hypothetical protein
LSRPAQPAQLSLDSGPARILVADPIAEDGIQRLRAAVTFVSLRTTRAS